MVLFEQQRNPSDKIVDSSYNVLLGNKHQSEKAALFLPMVWRSVELTPTDIRMRVTLQWNVRTSRSWFPLYARHT